MAGKDTAEITFQTPQRAITPGQFAVIYKETELLGSGIIEK
jgi:tRNA U34 2-thiouridine synthase MnmA/TrmU